MKIKYLSQIPSGKEVIIKDVLGCQGFKHRLYGLGIFPGEKVLVFKNDRGPIILKVGNTKLALGRGQAQKILVEEL